MPPLSELCTVNWGGSLKGSMNIKVDNASYVFLWSIIVPTCSIWDQAETRRVQPYRDSIDIHWGNCLAGALGDMLWKTFRECLSQHERSEKQKKNINCSKCFPIWWTFEVRYLQFNTKKPMGAAVLPPNLSIFFLEWIPMGYVHMLWE